VQVSDGTRNGSSVDRCLLCGREAVCSMADLNDSDKGQIATMLKQVLELSELNDSMTSQVEAEKSAREEAVNKTTALAGEADSLRGKLGQALDLLRAYQKRVREMQQALVASDQALSALQSEHKSLLVRMPGGRAAPPTPPNRLNLRPEPEEVVGNLSAAVDSIAAALAAEADVLHTPRENVPDTAGAGQIPEPGTQENTPAPQPAPMPHLLDESSAALKRGVADRGVAKPGGQPPVRDRQSSDQSQTCEVQQAAAATDRVLSRHCGDDNLPAVSSSASLLPSSHGAAQATAHVAVHPDHSLVSTAGTCAVPPQDSPSHLHVSRHSESCASTVPEAVGAQGNQGKAAHVQPTGNTAENVRKTVAPLAPRDSDAVAFVGALSQGGVAQEAGGASRRRCLAFEEGNIGGVHNEASTCVAAARVDISSSSEEEDQFSCPCPVVKVTEPKLVSFAPQEPTVAAPPAPEVHPVNGLPSPHDLSSSESSAEDAAGSAALAARVRAHMSETPPGEAAALGELQEPELELLSILVENALSTSRDKSRSPEKSRARTPGGERATSQSPSKSRRGRPRVEASANVPPAQQGERCSSTSPAVRRQSPAGRADAAKRGRGRRPSLSKKDKLLQTRIRSTRTSRSTSQDGRAGLGSAGAAWDDHPLIEGANSTVEALLAPQQQEKLNGAEEFYDDSLFELVDMLEDVSVRK